MEFNQDWIAGFFDGEGSIGIYPRNKNRDGSIKYYVLVVSLAQSGSAGETICKKLQSIYGGSVYKQEQVNRKVQWKWNLSAEKAGGFLWNYVHRLQIKKPEAEVGIAFQALHNKRWDNPEAVALAEMVKEMKVII